MRIPEITDLIVSRYQNDILKPLFVVGERGIGKTYGVIAAAKALSLPIVHLRVATQEEADLLGRMNSKNGRTVYDTPPWLLEEKFLLFLDEPNRQLRMEVLNALTQLIEPIDGEYRFATHTLPKGSYVVLAGNPDNGHYEVVSFDPAWADRITCITAEFHYDSFHNYMTTELWDPRLIKFLEQHRDLAFQKPSTDKDKKTPSPRAWETINSYLKTGQISNPLTDLAIEEVAGDIGNEASIIFAEFIRKEGNVVAIDPDDLWNNFPKLEDDIVEAVKKNRNDKISQAIDTILLKVVEDPKLQKADKSVKQIIKFALSKKIPDTFRLLLLKRIIEEHPLDPLYQQISQDDRIIKEAGKIAPK